LPQDNLCLGREKELGVLMDYMESAIEGQGKLVLVVGEPGIGKTTLLEKLAKRASNEGVRILHGKCLYNESAAPYLPFLDAMKPYMVDSEDEEDSSVSSAGSIGLLGMAAFEGTEEMGSIGFLGASAGEGLSSDVDLSEERGRLFEQISDTFEKIAEDTPLLLTLDDLHWADEGTLQLLHHLARRLPDMRALIVGAYTPEEVKDTAVKNALNTVLGRMASEHLYEEFELGPLPAEYVAEIAKNILGTDNVSNTFIDNLYFQSKGNPFYLEEVLNTILREHSAGTAWQADVLDNIPMPRSLTEVIDRRLDSLQFNSLKILKTASIIGNEFHFDILKNVANLEEDPLLDALDELLDSNLIQETGTKNEEEVYRFESMQIRSLLYKRMSQSRRRIMHSRIAKATETLHQDDLDDVLFTLARDYTLGKNYSKAYMYALQAGNKAMKLYAIEDAQNYYRTALESVEMMKEGTFTKEKMELMGRIADLSSMVGDWDEGINYYKLLIPLAKREEDITRVAESYRKIGNIYRMRGKWDQANEYFNKSLNLAETLGDGVGVANAHRGLGYVHWRLGEYDDALEHYDEVVSNAKTAGDMHTVAITYIDIGNVYSDRGDIENAIKYYNRSLVDLEKYEDYGEMARAYNNLGDKALSGHDWNKAIDYFDKCEEMANKVGDKDMMAWSKFNKAEAYAKSGRLDEAMTNNNDAFQLCKRLNDLVGLGAIYSNYGIIYRFKKDWDQAKENFERSIEIMKRLKSPYMIATRYIEYANMFKDKGDDDNAKKYLIEARKIFEELDSEKYLKEIDELLKKNK